METLVSLLETKEWDKLNLLLPSISANDLNFRYFRVNYSNSRDYTLLHFAIKHGAFKCVEKLLSLNVDINSRTLEGDTPLILLCKNSAPHELIDLILRRGANVYMANDHGNHAMHYAFFNRLNEVITILFKIDAGLLTAANAYGKKPIDLVPEEFIEELNIENTESNIVLLYNTQQAIEERQLKYLTGCINMQTNSQSLSHMESIGSFVKSAVFKAKFQNRAVFVKKILNENIPISQIQIFKSELKKIRQLYHPNLVFTFAYSTKNGTDLMLITEYLPFSLKDLIHDSEVDLDALTTLQMSLQIATAMKYLHQNNCFHLNLKPSNCLLTENQTIKLSDYGFMNCEFGNSFKSARIYNPEYFAPELLQCGSYSQLDLKAIDCFAFGILLFELVTRARPYPTTSLKIGLQVLEGARPIIPSFVPNELAALMQSCWNVTNRPLFSQIESSLGVILKEY